MAYIIRDEDQEATRSPRYEFTSVVLEETEDRRKPEESAGWVDGRLAGNPVLRQANMGWQVTATTVSCEYVADFATIMVQPDGTAKCSFVNRYGKVKDGRKKLKKCKWPDCPLVAGFKDKALTL